MGTPGSTPPLQPSTVAPFAAFSKAALKAASLFISWDFNAPKKVITIRLGVWLGFMILGSSRRQPLSLEDLFF